MTSSPADGDTDATGATSLPLGDLLALGNQLRADVTPESLLQDVAETLQHLVLGSQVYVRVRHTDTDYLEAIAFAAVAEPLRSALRATAISPHFYQPLLRTAGRIADSVLLPPDQIARLEPPPIDTLLPRAAMLLLLLRGRGDRLLGAVYVILPPDQQTPDEALLTAVAAIARQGALGLENVRLAERSARLLAKEQLLAELGRDVSATLDLEAIVSRTVMRLEAAFGNGSLTLLDDDDVLEVVAATSGAGLPAGTLAQSDQGIVGWVVSHGQSCFINDTAEDTRFQALVVTVDNCLLLPYRACIVAALRSGGQTIGTLNVGSIGADTFAFEDVDLLEAIAAQVGGPITSARLYEQSQRLAAQVQRRAEQLTVLNTIARTATASLDQKHMLPEVTRQLRDGFGYDHVDLFLVDEETNELVLAALASGRVEARIGYRQHSSIGLLGRAVRSQQIVNVADVQQEADYLMLAERSDTRAELIVPITASGRVLGLLNLESPQLGDFDHEDVALLETVADVLAGALDNARLSRRSQAAAVLEERNRLARELHDSVTQQLFSMTLTAQAARAHLEKNPQRAAQQLERLQETATAALAEMRALIFQLRPPALRDQGLVAALQQHAAMLAHRESLRIELNVTGDERMARGIEQPLYRIVQEALNNVIKHAQADQVSVGLEFGVDRVRLRVRDDGQGFDPDAPPSPSGRHLGVISMRERAAEIGGTMEILSSIGGGTEVVVTVPRT
jgi:signal transduction histidine kinase